MAGKIARLRECAWRGSGVCYNPPQIIRGSTCLIVMESTHPPPRFIELKRDLSIIQGAREGTHVKGQLFFRTSSRPKVKDREVVKHGKSAPSGSSAYIYNSQRFRWKTLASGLNEARGEGFVGPRPHGARKVFQWRRPRLRRGGRPLSRNVIAGKFVMEFP